MQEIRPDEPIPVGAGIPTRELTFNLDGTIDSEQLVGFPQEFIDRVTSPEFIAETAQKIAALRRRDLSIHFFKQKAGEIRAAADRQHQSRRPDGVSGRQRKRLRRAARRMARATILSGVETNGQSIATIDESDAATGSGPRADHSGS